jgi:hypothetical protein
MPDRGSVARATNEPPTKGRLGGKVPQSFKMFYAGARSGVNRAAMRAGRPAEEPLLLVAKPF